MRRSGERETRWWWEPGRQAGRQAGERRWRAVAATTIRRGRRAGDPQPKAQRRPAKAATSKRAADEKQDRQGSVWIAPFLVCRLVFAAEPSVRRRSALSRADRGLAGQPHSHAMPTVHPPFIPLDEAARPKHTPNRAQSARASRKGGGAEGDARESLLSRLATSVGPTAPW